MDFSLLKDIVLATLASVALFFYIKGWRKGNE